MRPLDGYPSSIGYQMASVFPHAGPAAYAVMVVTPDTVPAVGGDTVEAKEAGLKYLDKVIGGVSDDGMWAVEAVPVSSSATQQSAPSITWLLRWFARKTVAYGGQAQTAGLEAVVGTVLTAAIVRLLAIGPKA